MTGDHRGDDTRPAGTSPVPVGGEDALPDGDVDVIVVGSGPNGLTAAALIAAAGLRVHVLEAHPERWGGALGSRALTRPGFVNDVGAAFFPFASSSPALKALRLQDFGLRFSRAAIESAHPALDGSCGALPRDVEQLGRHFEHGEDADRWASLLRWHASIEPRLFDAMLRTLPNVGNVLRLGPGNLLRMASLFTASGGRLSRRLFRGEDARRIIPALALHTDVGPDDTFGAGIGYMLAMTACSGGFAVPVGGAQAFADALVARLRANGGTISLGCRVTRIRTDRGHARGVCVERDGELIDMRARVGVVANTSVPALFCELIERGALPGRLVRFGQRFPSGWGTFKVDWALGGAVPWAAEAARAAAVVHTGEDVNDLSRFTREARDGRLPDNPYLVIGQQSLVDPTRAPAGQATLWAYSRVPARSPRGWDSDAERFADRIDARIEALAPGFRAQILARTITTPRGLQQMNANLIGGDLGGGSNAWHRQLIFRPLFPYFRHRTPVRGLYLSSSYTHPGAGVHGMCGYNAAQQVLADAGRSPRSLPASEEETARR